MAKKLTDKFTEAAKCHEPKTRNPEPETIPATNAAPVEPSYFTRRVIQELGISEEQNRIRLKFYQAEANTWQEVEYQIFAPDDDDNIKITPFTIERQLIEYDNQAATPEKPNIANARRKNFYITRLKNPEEYTNPKTGEKGVKKYDIPKGAGTYPFFSPSLCDKFERKAKIKTLVATEGYFKAAKGAISGLDIVGLSSITHYKQKDTDAMYTDILRIIKDCQVENFIILYDGDARNLSLSHLQHKKDLRLRPSGFINSARAVRELLKDCENLDIYFACVKSEEVKGNPKGLDDLYCALPDQTADITADLLALSRPANYFHRLNIRVDVGKLYKFFCLDTIESFYEFHRDLIREREFIYNGTTYIYNSTKGICDVVIPKAATDYFRVGDDYYKFVMIPNKYQQNERKFMKRLKSTISDDHEKKFLKYIAKYEAFCNVPDHVNFQQVFNNCFNVYAPFEWEPEAGECTSILDFIRHIFGDHYEYGLDYIQLLYQRPTQILPILCLVSKQNKTGKSTFIKLLKAIFTQNCTIVGNDDLGNDFNGFWATKLIVACEESFIEKKSIVEKLKALSTSDKMNMNKKGKDQEEIDFFAKFILASNNEDTFIFASRDDVRYWVRQVPVFSGKEKVNLLREMIDEIPAFLDYLNKRQMYTQNETRMWFNENLLKTEALEKLIHNSRPGLEKEIYERLKSIFIEFGESEIYLTLTDINELILKKQDLSYLSKIFNDNFGVRPYTNSEGKQTVKYYSIPMWQTNSEGEPKRHDIKKVGRPYVFNVDKILDKTDLDLWHDLYGKTAKKPEAEQITIDQAIAMAELEADELKKIPGTDIPF
jgi:hypothetical protein